MPSGKLDNHIFKWFLFLGPCEIVVVFRVCGPLSEASCKIVIVRVMWNCGCPAPVLAKNEHCPQFHMTRTITISYEASDNGPQTLNTSKPRRPTDNHNFT